MWGKELGDASPIRGGTSIRYHKPQGEKRGRIKKSYHKMADHQMNETAPFILCP
jgi:hypothetical protein